MDYKDLNDYELIYQVKEQDEIAYNTLITKYSNLVKILAKNYMKKYKKSSGYDYDDLYQVGMMGILYAIDYYDSEDTKFYTYALLCARREIEKIIKIDSRQKNKVLSEAVSLNAVVSKSSNNPITLGDLVSSNITAEDELLSTYDLNDIISMKYNFDFLESQIYELKINGFSLIEISKLLEIPYRKVDYSLQKIKKKIITLI